jgi:hypothetical protein
VHRVGGVGALVSAGVPGVSAGLGLRLPVIPSPVRA